MASALAADGDALRALDRTLAIVVAAFGLEAGWIWLIDPETERFYLAASCGLPPYLREPVQMTGEPCWCIEAFFDGDFVSKNVRVIDCSRLRKAVRDGMPELTGGLKSHASAALRFGERQLGILNVSAPQWHPLDARSLRLLSVLGAQIGVAVERARLADVAAAVARSEERTRLAREIHDTIAQDLTAIALQLESALRHLDGEPASARARISTALAVTRSSLGAARESVSGLRSDPLGGKPLAAMLGALARAFTSESGIIASFHDATTRAVPYATEAELYRIASESLTNVRRHARAHRVDIRLQNEAETVALLVEDDGSGYAPQGSGGRFGVVGMAERARSLGGTFAIASREEGGTRLEARIPSPP